MQTPSFQQFMNADNSMQNNMYPQSQYPNSQQYPQQYNQQQYPQQQNSQLPVMSQQKVQVVASNQHNPFAMDKYSNVQLPDIPLHYNGGLTEALLNDNEVPEAIRKKYWFVFHKDNTLTFLDDERKRSKLLNFDISKIDILNTMPYYDYTFDEELNFGVLRNVFETKLDRSLGFKGTAQRNERIVLQSQFQENRQISENGDGQTKESFFKRLLGRR